ncbi:sulfurtransferase TusA family protein [Evansella cellulosilytica]|uniref:SirA-like domain-containing protein n=1 Tax=Evansella cellulosilytica (strain ATCC 21833 / DSM 2522 / FERM P-1141 / JCM 9156 / N-4) TaxID=649639 RepID=E6TTF4_EVAC2|nr:sulfurtransferase TusA family protein [Evansella cellulosilytica]ADU29590.1 SirA-like domain-containing protein [Evansella cellulosilytica DSM 2522]
MGTMKYDQLVDAKGLACPMPIVRTKKAMNDLEPGKVIEVQATDKGSTTDLKAWAQSTGHQYLGTIEDNGVLKHYLRKENEEEKKVRKHPNVATNEELQVKLDNKEDILVLDVREKAEYTFHHIPGAACIPLGELDRYIGDLKRDQSIYVVCRTGYRSDIAAQKLSDAGFKNVVNVVPGMSEWS